MNAIDKADLGQVQQLIVAGQMASALAALTPILTQDPENVEARYMRAVCCRRTGAPGEALAELETIKQLSPGHGRAYQEEGHVYRLLQDPARALIAYRRACQFNPALVASWQAQQELLKLAGRTDEAAAVAAWVTHLKLMPAPVVAVMDLVAQGRLVRAEEICRAFLKANPRHVEAMRLLADIGLRLGVLEDAEFLLESALAFAPDNTQVHIDYVRALRKRQKFVLAREEAEKLLASAPDNPQFQSIYAVECMQTGDFDRALRLFDKVLARLPNDPVTLTSRGHALKTSGRAADAIASYRQAIASHPAYGEAYYALANLKTYRFLPQELAQMHEQENDTSLSHMDRVYLNFALGKAYEDSDTFDTAFHYYAEGNALKKAESRYSAEKMTAELQAQQRLVGRDLIAAQGGQGCDAPDPIFVVGLPRAGSTLLEQILSSHSQIDGTLELPNILSLSQRLRRMQAGETRGYPEVLAHLTPTQLQAFGQEYIDDTRIHRLGAPYFIDKMPNNFRHIGLIKLILPNARIIDARRDAMACCFSGFKQLFAEGQEFTYSLHDAGTYYRDYVDLMTHWDEVFPGQILRVQHEDVVADLDQEVRRMLDFLGLPFEQACLDFHQTERNVRTPSSEQVRQPIFDSSLDQWRNFERFLDPLREALGPLA
ncbi:MAG: tetratricopeptide repeat-containing sulfotransferase family protein [Pseudomonadota bacterium]